MRSDHLRRELAAALMRIDARDLAKASGLPLRIIGMARAMRPISAAHHLRIAAAIDFDPMPDLPFGTRPDRRGEFDRILLGVAFRLRRALNKQSVRQAGSAIGVSGFTVSRLENGRVTSIDVVLKACRYVGVHPFGFFTCFTRNTNANTLNPNGHHETKAA